MIYRLRQSEGVLKTLGKTSQCVYLAAYLREDQHIFSKVCRVVNLATKRFRAISDLESKEREYFGLLAYNDFKQELSKFKDDVVIRNLRSILKHYYKKYILLADEIESNCKFPLDHCYSEYVYAYKIDFWQKIRMDGIIASGKHGTFLYNRKAFDLLYKKC